MEKILLLGSNGMLGQALTSQFIKDGYELHTVDKIDAEYTFDVLDDDRLRYCIEDVLPDIIVNTVAIVNLNDCEEDRGSAYCLNARVPGILSEICAEKDLYLIHISTDHFFRGDRDKKHSEKDEIKLVNEYSRTKYIGEQLALRHKKTLVVRTNIVGFRGKGQQTFIEWAIDEIRKKNSMNLFGDFYTSSIHTVDFAKILSDLMLVRPSGIINLASSDVTNKKDFILGLSETLFGNKPEYREVSLKSLTGAPRGDSLGLDVSKIEMILGYKMPDRNDTFLSIKREYERRFVLDEI